MNVRDILDEHGRLNGDKMLDMWREDTVGFFDDTADAVNQHIDSLLAALYQKRSPERLDISRELVDKYASIRYGRNQYIIDNLNNGRDWGVAVEILFGTAGVMVGLCQEYNGAPSCQFHLVPGAETMGDLFDLWRLVTKEELKELE